jgi:hypothetical protein
VGDSLRRIEMSRALIVSLVVILGFALVSPPRALAKKAHPATEPATTQPASKSKDKDADDDDDAAVEKHKKRAVEIGKGKELDKEATKGKLDKLTTQVNDLDKKLKEKEAAKKDPTPTTKKGAKRADPPEEEEAPAAKKHKARTPTPPADEDEDKDERPAKGKK